MSTGKRGRPEGSKTADRAELEIRVDPCPDCGCTLSPSNMRRIREGSASGTHDGRQYWYYILWYGNCQQCNRKIKAFQYSYAEEPAEKQKPN